MELARTFNCGIGMVLVVERERVGRGKAPCARKARPFTPSAASSWAAGAGRARVELVNQNRHGRAASPASRS
jgi:hypothetical protein